MSTELRPDCRFFRATPAGESLLLSPDDLLVSLVDAVVVGVRLLIDVLFCSDSAK